MKTYKPDPGETIQQAAAEMVRLANFGNEVVTASFNEIPLDTAPGGDADSIVKAYWAETNAQRAAYEASPEYAKAQQERKGREARKERELTAALATAPAKLTLNPAAADDWQKCVEVNNDGYGRAVMVYADQWARVMEARIAAGETVESCAEEASQVAENQGITGFQYGCAVGILAKCWVHGERLRRWHNLKTQIRNEGEKANESGGVLNPALLNIG